VSFMSIVVLVKTFRLAKLIHNTSQNNAPPTVDGSSSTWDHVDKNKNINKPYLIVHIGPSKTGTSTLQHDSCDFEEALALDNYIYGGRYSKREYHQASFILDEDVCLYETEAYLLNFTSTKNHTENKAIDVPCWKEKISKFNKFSNSNFVISDEAFSYYATNKKNLKYYAALNTVLSSDWNLFYVVTYRRYAEWLLSAIKENNPKAKCSGRESEWDSYDSNDRQKHGRCEDIWNKVKGLAGRPDYNTGRYLNIDNTTLYLQAAGIPFTILNFHGEKHITEAFYCDSIQSTPHACLQSLKQKTVSNAKTILESTCSIIVNEAKMRGLMVTTMTNTNYDKKNQTRHEATISCVDFMERNQVSHADLPLICPRRIELEKLLDKSLKFEALMVPDFFKSDKGESMHRNSFWKMVDEKKELCNVNVDELLKGKKSWGDVLEYLAKKNYTRPMTYFNDHTHLSKGRRYNKTIKDVHA